MKKSKIDEINSAVEEVVSSDKSDESIFNLGVELGKYLVVSGENFERLEFFTRKEEEIKKDVRIKEKSKKISELISKIVYWACLKQIEISGSIKFEADAYQRSRLNSLNSEVVKDFSVHCKSVTQEDEDREFDIEFEVVGKIAEIFEKYEAQKIIYLTVENLSATSNIIISNSKQLRELLSVSWMFFNRNLANYDEKKLDDFFDDLNKATLMTQMRYSDV